MSMQSIPQDKLQDIVGQKLEPGKWVTVDQERINTFADCTEDKPALIAEWLNMMFAG